MNDPFPEQDPKQPRRAARTPDSLSKPKQLPDTARRDLAVCLVDARGDPLGCSEPYGQDDGTVRTVTRGHVAAVILIGRDTRVLTVLALACAGPV